MSELKIPLNGGLCTSKDPADLRMGQLVRAEGIYYKPGDTGQAHILPTRGAFNSSAIGTGAVLGCAVCQFDAGGTDQLLAYFEESIDSTTIYHATPGTTGSFTSLITGLNPSATRMSVCHDDDRWYIANGYDRVQVLESDGTTRAAGMLPPDAAPVVTTSTTAGTTYRPATPSVPVWTDTDKARDSNGETFSYATLGRTIGFGKTEIWSFGAQAFTAGTINVKFHLVGIPTAGGSTPVGVGGFGPLGFLGEVVLTLSTDSGSTYPTTIGSINTSNASPDPITAQVVVSGLTNLSTVRVKAAFLYVNGLNDGTARVYEIRATTSGGSESAAFTFVDGVYYAYTEFDGIRESPASPVSAFVAPLVNMRSATLTLPGIAGLKNTTTTLFKIYRTFDGGAAPQTLGYVGQATPTATSTVFLDDYILVPFDSAPTPLLRLQQISSNREGDLFASIDAPPPDGMKTLTAYGGGLVGCTITNPRELRYSEPGYPESWPPLNVIDKLSLPEHDEIVHQVAIDNSLLVACSGAMVILTDLPRVLDGTFNTAQAKPMQGQPGCVGQDALITYSVAGEPRAVWVSRYGIHETNGVTSRRLTNSIDWAAKVVTASLDTAILHWNPKDLRIKFCYDSTGLGANDKFLLIHMAPEHQGDDGPLITGPFAAAIYSLCSGEVAGVYREYSGHPSNGVVSLEESTGAEQVAVQTGRVYGDGNRFRVARGNLRHSGMAAQSATITWSAGEDANDVEQTIVNTVALDSRKGTEFWVNRAGEWASVLIEYDGSVAGSFLDIRADAKPTGKVGRIAV